MLLALVPYGAPTNLRLATPEIQKIFVEWDEVDAALKNGMIKGYKIHYKLDGQEEKTKDVKGGGVFQTTLEELFANTWYNVCISAYTSVGDGKRSAYKEIKTQTQSKFRISYFL